MSDVEWFSSIGADIVDDDGWFGSPLIKGARGILLWFSWYQIPLSLCDIPLYQGGISKALEYIHPDSIYQKQVHISTRCIGWDEYISVFCEFSCDLCWDDIRCFSSGFREREDVDTVFSEFSLRCDWYLRCIVRVVEWLECSGDDGIECFHNVRYYRKKIRKIERKLEFIVEPEFFVLYGFWHPLWIFCGCIQSSTLIHRFGVTFASDCNYLFLLFSCDGFCLTDYNSPDSWCRALHRSEFEAMRHALRYKYPKTSDWVTVHCNKIEFMNSGLYQVDREFFEFSGESLRSESDYLWGHVVNISRWALGYLERLERYLSYVCSVRPI